VDFFIRRWEEEGRGEPVFLTPAAMNVLARYEWPGNVRELENVMERLLVLSGGEKVGPGSLPEKIRRGVEIAPEPLVEEERDEEMLTGSSPDPISSTATGGGLLMAEALLGKDFNLAAFLGDLERTLVRQALERAGGNRSRAAEILGLNRTTLIEKIRRFGIS
jgi:sigma-54 specific flagellar transcriptional regulator A